MAESVRADRGTDACGRAAGVSRVAAVDRPAAARRGLVVLVGWPLLGDGAGGEPLVGYRAGDRRTGDAIDPAATSQLLRDTGAMARPARPGDRDGPPRAGAPRLLALPVGRRAGVPPVPDRRPGPSALARACWRSAAFVPLPLHATAWLGALGNAGRMQAIGVRPILVGRFGRGGHPRAGGLALGRLRSAGVGFRAVEPELEESAAAGHARAGGSGCASPCGGASVRSARRPLAVAVLTAGDMTVTDLLQVRTYAEEAYVQFTLGRGPADAAVVSIPPLVGSRDRHPRSGRGASIAPIRCGSPRPSPGPGDGDSAPGGFPSGHVLVAGGRQPRGSAALQPGLAGRTGRRPGQCSGSLPPGRYPAWRDASVRRVGGMLGADPDEPGARRRGGDGHGGAGLDPGLARAVGPGSGRPSRSRSSPSRWPRPGRWPGWRWSCAYLSVPQGLRFGGHHRPRTVDARRSPTLCSSSGRPANPAAANCWRPRPSTAWARGA